MSREKQIKEMAKDLCGSTMCDLETFNNCRMPRGNCSRCQRVAEDLYNADYRKQSKGEWIFDCEECFMDLACFTCSNCKTAQRRVSPYCPNCGAKMKGGE